MWQTPAWPVCQGGEGRGARPVILQLPNIRYAFIFHSAQLASFLLPFFGFDL
jgi:hypothetical protein